MKTDRSPLFRLILPAAVLWCACAAPEQKPFPHVLGGSSSDSVGGGGGGGGAAAGATANGGAPAAAGGLGGAVVGGAGGVGGGVAGGGTTATATGGGGAGGAAPDCPSGAPVKAGCACTANADDAKSCQALSAGIAHRYSFTGSGTTITDSAGNADGAAIDVSLTNTGDLDFTSGDQYADLPNQLVSTLTNATVEAWVTWQSGNAWQRIFDFGEDATGAENNRSTGRSYLFLSPKGTGDFVRAVFKAPTGMETVIDSTPSLTSGALSHVAVVFDDDNDAMTLYVNGILGGSVAVTDHLSAINDINDWLGRSQFASDPPFAGSMQEFRIYSVALTASEILFSQSQGPDAAFFSQKP